MGKVVRNSILSMIVGIVISILACVLKDIAEPVNYVGAMFLLGGMIFLDQCILQKIFKSDMLPKVTLIRLPVYLLLAVVLILVPMYLSFYEPLMRVLRSFGIAFLLLALWRFFTFTTVEEEKMH